jgi:uncharacterized protein YggE
MSTKKMLTIVAVVLSLTLVTAACADVAAAGGGSPQTAQVATYQTGDPMPRTISVNGVGVATAQPDVAVIHLGVEVINTDAGQAISESTDRMTALMAVLKEMQIQDSDIQTENYSMWLEQVYDRDGQPTDQVRYHVVNQLRVRLHALDKTGELLQKALEAGANTVNGISFSVADPEALQQAARELAVANAKAKAEQLAAGLGVKVGALHQVSEYGGSAPVMEAARVGMGGGGDVPVAAGEFSVTVEIQVVFDIAE